MYRKQMQQHLYEPLHEPLEEVLQLVNRLYSPQALGYKEFPDGGDAEAGRTEEDWAALGLSREHRMAYRTYSHTLNVGKQFARLIREVGDERYPLWPVLNKLSVCLGDIYGIPYDLQGINDRSIIDRLDAAVDIVSARCTALEDQHGLGNGGPGR